MPRRAKPLPDSHVLYQRAVQAPDSEVEFADRVYHRLRGRRASRLREDFCGTAAIACKWVKLRKTNTAVGVDLHRETLDWARAHNVAKLPIQAQRRIELLHRNVVRPSKRGIRMDAVLALNFSWWVFKTRPALVRYFRSVRRSLSPGGLFLLDIYGGPDSIDELRERRKIGGGLTYIWDQEKVDPITNQTLCHIHFRLADGRSIRKAFTYDWRIWSIPEARDALADAGFKRSTVYWEGDDGKGGGNGIFTPAEHGECCAAFIAYIVAER
jgi:SAM-dependent methyltransferase